MKKLMMLATTYALFAVPSNAAIFLSKADYDAMNATTNSITFDAFAPNGFPLGRFTPLETQNASIFSSAGSISFADETYARLGFPVAAVYSSRFGSTLTVDFDAPVSSAGFSIAQGFQGGNVTINLFNNLTNIGSFVINANDQTVFNSFFGVNDIGPITSVGLTADRTGFIAVSEIQSLTNMPAVPEPSTWAFMIVGFGAIGGALRSKGRRQRKANVKVSYA